MHKWCCTCSRQFLQASLMSWSGWTSPPTFSFTLLAAFSKNCARKHDQSNSSTHNRSQNNNMIDQSPSYIFWTQHGCLHWSWAAERSAEDPWKWQGLYNYTQTHAQTTQILQMTWAHYPVIGQSCLTMKTNDHFILKYLLVDLPNRHLWAPSSAMHLSVFDHDVPGVLPFGKTWS